MSVAAPQRDDAESRDWLHDLRTGGAVADEAVARLHALLLRAARFEVSRRSQTMPPIRDAEDVAFEAASEALRSVRAHLDDYRGDTRFTTWASKFAVLETSVKLRRRAWEGRELPTTSAAMQSLAEIRLEPAAAVEQRELLDVLRDGIGRLTPDQRDVLVALAVNGVPIDVLAERRATSRGALYETLRAARGRLRRDADDAGLS